MRFENCSKEKAWDEEVTSGVEKLPRAPMCLLSVICHHYNYNTKSARLYNRYHPIALRTVPSYNFTVKVSWAQIGDVSGRVGRKD